MKMKILDDGAQFIIKYADGNKQAIATSLLTRKCVPLKKCTCSAAVEKIEEIK